MEYRDLGRTALRVSVLGFGASPLGNEFGPVDTLDGERAVHAAIQGGINFFDVSPFYGRTLAEERLGQALLGYRDRVILSTKCGRYDKHEFDFSAARVRSSMEDSLRRLHTDHVDVLLAHDIEFGDREQILDETLPAMRDLQRQGKARYIGVSGLPLQLLADVAQRADLDVVLSYCHYNLLARDLDDVLTPVAKARGIGLINAAPLHMRLLSTAGAPAWHSAAEAVKQTGAEVVSAIQRYGLAVSAVALRFCIEHPYVSSTLVGMSNVEEVRENVKALDFQLPLDLLREIDRITAPVRSISDV